MFWKFDRQLYRLNWLRFLKFIFYAYYSRILLNAMFMLNWWEIVYLCSLNRMVQTLRSGKITWKIVLEFIDLDYTLRTDGPLLSLKSLVKEKANYDKWERPYRMCLMVIKHTIFITIRGCIPDKYALQWQRKHKGVHYGNVQSCF